MQLLLLLYAFAVPYLHIQATAEVSNSAVSRFVTVRIHLRRMGDTATACVVKAGRLAKPAATPAAFWLHHAAV
jgi:hypothetical protein